MELSGSRIPRLGTHSLYNAGFAREGASTPGSRPSRWLSELSLNVVVLNVVVLNAVVLNICV